MFADSPYKIRGVRIIDNSGYNLLNLESMRENSRMLDNVINTRNHGHVLCSSLQLRILYKALVSQLTEDRTSSAPYHVDLGSKGEDGEAVEK